MKSRARKGLSIEAKEHRNEFHISSRKMSDNFFTVEEFGWKYVAVHPVADENWWFEKFKESPEICTSADFYWQLDGDVVFLEIITKKHREFKNEAFFARWNGNRINGLLNLHAWVLDELIFSQTVERVMKRFWEFHQNKNLFETFYLKKNLKEFE